MSTIIINMFQNLIQFIFTGFVHFFYSKFGNPPKSYSEGVKVWKSVKD